ncbi:MAG: hypothetical protein QXQ60_02955 [Thermofilum sp.]
MRRPRGFPEWGLLVGGVITAAFLVLAVVGSSLVGERAVSSTVYVDGRAYQIPPLLPPGTTIEVGVWCCTSRLGRISWAATSSLG